MEIKGHNLLKPATQKKVKDAFPVTELILFKIFIEKSSTQPVFNL